MTSPNPARSEAVTPAAPETVTPASILAEQLKAAWAREDELNSRVLRLQRELGQSEAAVRQLTDALAHAREVHQGEAARTAALRELLAQAEDQLAAVTAASA